MINEMDDKEMNLFDRLYRNELFKEYSEVEFVTGKALYTPLTEDMYYGKDHDETSNEYHIMLNLVTAKHNIQYDLQDIYNFLASKFGEKEATRKYEDLSNKVYRHLDKLIEKENQRLQRKK
jgi:hypothetical protein